MGFGELVMVIEGKNMLDSLSVREPGFDRSWAAKNVCHVGVEVEVGEEGAAIAFIRFSTTAAISAVHLSLSCLPRSNVLSTGRCTSGMVAKHRCTSALMAKRRPSSLEANLFATWPPATRMRRQAVRKRWAVQHRLVPRRAVQHLVNTEKL